MPTLTLAVALLLPLTLPSTRQLLQSTRELEPMADALLRFPAATFALLPMSVLLLPVVLSWPDEAPMKVLL